MSISSNISSLVNAAGQLSVVNNTSSTSTATGAVIIAGGTGIAKDLYVGGSVYSNGPVYSNGYAISTATALPVQSLGTPLGTVGTINFGTSLIANVANNILTVQAGSFSANFAGVVSTIVWTMDGAGNTVVIGDKAVIQIPYACNITQATVVGVNTGSALIYVSTTTLASWPSRTLISSSTISLTNSRTLQISTSSWSNTFLSTGSFLVASVQTVNTFTFLTLSLSVTRI